MKIVKKITSLLKNSLVAILHGEFLLRLKVGNFLPQIAYTFFLFAMIILFTLMVDGTLSKVETNKVRLRNLSVEHTQKEYELIMLSRRSTVSNLLIEKGSTVAEPVKPATHLD
ncbi:MAG: hypothetical protein MJY80_04270 [Bacteroidales bacterium]|nr:hypothetical protein [Bacteroidales bacterium]